MRTLGIILIILAYLGASSCGGADKPPMLSYDEASTFTDLDSLAVNLETDHQEGTDDPGQYAELDELVPEAITIFRAHPNTTLDSTDNRTTRQALSDIAGTLENTHEWGQEDAADIDRALKNP
ncbi:MAG: hypothetical protein JHD02_00025 [Thermoleophilaceae bacterium]|nr:hypothetical protein [Thermoleophilaceae bacterium]